MPDHAFPTRPAAAGRRRRLPPRIDASAERCVRRAVVLPLLLIAAVLGAAFSVWTMSAATPSWLLASLACGLVGVGLVAARGARTAAWTVQRAVEAERAAELSAVAGVAAAIEKSVQWSADELCRGARPPLPERQIAEPVGATAEIDKALSALQVQAVASLIHVHDESQSVVLLEVLRRLAMREHALVGKALEALTHLERLTDDPELLSKIFEIDHLVTRMRRQVESTAVLGGQSLRNVRRPVTVTTTLRGAISEVVQYPRVVVAAGSVGAELERVRTESQQVPETEKRLREAVTRLKKTITNKNAEIERLRQQVTNLTLASAVLTQKSEASTGLSSTPDNVIPLRPPSS